MSVEKQVVRAAEAIGAVLLGAAFVLSVAAAAIALCAGGWL